MLRLSDFDYHLPEQAIAQNPAEPRDASRLLVLGPDSIEHRYFCDIADYFEPGDLLVLNNTRVTARRLIGARLGGGKSEALLLRDLGGGEFQALVKPAKKFKKGTSIKFDGMTAEVTSDSEDGVCTLKFDDPTSIADAGSIPLPPYIHASNAPDERYQTIYAETAGSSAAPTAGLHFTDDVFGRLRAKGVKVAFVTLDVGIDTFRPVKVENLEHHKMHGERYSIPVRTREAVANTTGKVIAVGTTTVRALETAAIGERAIKAGEGCSSIFITPGYKFKVVDELLTNFHMPRTTMLLMVAAFCGRERLMAAYQEALNLQYRFLSFGDSMLVTSRPTGEKHAQETL